MAKKPNVDAAGVSYGLSGPCNAYMTNGVHLEDVAPLTSRVFDAAKFKAQGDIELAGDTFPTFFLCSHCGSNHAITLDELKDVIFNNGGGVDVTAAANQIKAMFDDIDAQAAIAPESVNGNILDELVASNDGSDSSADGTNPDGGQ